MEIEGGRKRLRKTTGRQYEELLNYVEKHKVLIHGKTKPSEAKVQTDLWHKFAHEINPRLGPLKTAEQWKKIFAEWKVNTKRKSRLIASGLMGTGGGSATKRELTYMEQSLLALISKAHLGDADLPDDDELPVVVSEDLNLVGNVCIPESAIAQVGPAVQPPPRPATTPLDVSYKLMAPVSTNRTPQKKEVAPLLEGACATQDMTHAIECLSAAVVNLADSQAQLAQATMLRARAEYAKAKVEHFKIFGCLDDFDK